MIYQVTVMQVHKGKGRPDTSESRMWVYSSTQRAGIQLRCFDYRKSRSGKWAKDFLEGFSGVLIMGTAKANSLRLDDYLPHLLSILPGCAEQSKDFETDDLLPRSGEMKSWFSAVCVPGTTTFVYRRMIERLRFMGRVPS